MSESEQASNNNLSSNMEAVSIASSQSSSSTDGSEINEDVERRYQTVRSIGEKCIQEEELKNLLAKKAAPICYDGFEPSGRMHIAQGVMKVINVNKLASAGCRVKIWIADVFAKLNNKMGGDMQRIRVVGEYFQEVWKAAGMNNDNVEYLWSSEEINAKQDQYWPLVLDIAGKNNLARILRCVQIMGRSETDELTAAQIFYACLQCADIFFLEADICQLGMDQRKVNVLAREYCDDIKRKNKPIILSHHMLPGLLQGQEKMSKSNTDSAIFMEDEEDEVNGKIKKAYCPPKIVQGNPCLEYVKYIILPWFDEFTVERKEEYGGNKTFKSFDEISAEYEKGELHPGDLKKGLASALNKILQPVRDHFKTDARAMNLLEQIKFLPAATAYQALDNNLSSKVEAVSIASSQASSSADGSQINEDVEKRYQTVRSIGEECIKEEELKNLLAKKAAPICYDGFEPSGRMHIAQGVMKVINVNKLTSAGCRVKIWIADLFAKLNNKMGGDLQRIRVVGEYFQEVWKAAGMNNDNVEYLWSSEEINAKADKYWPLVLDIGCKNTLARILRCVQIMGRNETDELTAAQIFYPCMQCADIFFLEADICQLGMDQRKVNVLAREYCDDIKRKNKPIILSHHMLPGLLQGQEKMSKSNTDSAIFMEDEEDEVNGKIKKAYCPPKIVQGNPCLEYVKYIILPWFDEFTVERKEEYGGNKTFKSFDEIAAEYEKGELHPGDLKKGLASALNKILQPVRDHFKTDARAMNLLEQIKGFKVTK